MGENINENKDIELRNTHMGKALVAMSGGVDSSVAAYLMREAGYTPVGITMRLYDSSGISETCCSINDVNDAREVCTRLGIEHIVINYMEMFREKVIYDFVRTYLRGGTPNPCIECNRLLKFGSLMKKADEIGADKVVTGHYARIEYKPEYDRYYLRRATDMSKDQTYVLYFLSQEQLGRIVLPLGSYEKSRTREMAEAAGLITAHKADSQDICFVPDGDYAGVIDEVVRAEAGHDTGFTALPGEGVFVDSEGNVLGKHRGYYHYTIGQRRGLGVSAAGRLYVTDIIPDRNVVVLGGNDELYVSHVEAQRFTLGSDILPDGTKMPIGSMEDTQSSISGVPFELPGITAKIRYNGHATPGRLRLLGGGRACVDFDSPVRAAAPGQSLVVYMDDYCIGGGVITI